MKTKIILFTLTVGALTALTARADLFDLNLTGEIRLGRRVPPPPQPIVVIVPDNGPRGPSAWEHGRWYEINQGYYYYPGGDTYYRPSDQMWFYLERGQWRSSRRLPEWVHIDFNHNITLTMRTARPYLYHQQVMARYPSNYFGARVRLREENRGDNRGRGRGNDHDGRDDDHDGRDKDRGNKR